ncbi:MAG: hypothetical protein EPGJADBJ_04625 [Saprospiraceae bacterium]|nr:hypothetical protein [Saprospiraceae bacterium]
MRFAGYIIFIFGNILTAVGLAGVGTHSPFITVLAIRFAATVVGIVCIFIGRNMVQKQKRLALVRNSEFIKLPSATSNLPHSFEYLISKPFVLYLRSFQADERMAGTSSGGVDLFQMASSEEQLVEVLRYAGDVIAIGKPNENMPMVGAKRLYVTDNEWQKTVLFLMENARLIVLLAGDSKGLDWELQNALQTSLRIKLILYVPYDQGAVFAFLHKLDKLIGSNLCAQSERIKAQDYGYVVYFDKNKNPVFTRLLEKSRLHRSFRKPLVPYFKYTFRPIFEQNDLTPPKLQYGGVGKVLCAILLIILLIIFVRLFEHS